MIAARSHLLAPCVPSAGCFFGDEVRGGGESCPASDTEASSDIERLGLHQPGPPELLDSPGSPPSCGTTEGAREVTGLATQTSGAKPHPGPLASPPAELPWTNIDLKEPKRAPSPATTGFPGTSSSGFPALGLLPLGLDEPYCADDHPLWAWVSGGACAVEAHTTLKWFSVQMGKDSAGGLVEGRGGMGCCLSSLCPARTARGGSAWHVGPNRAGLGQGGTGCHEPEWCGDLWINSPDCWQACPPQCRHSPWPSLRPRRPPGGSRSSSSSRRGPSGNWRTSAIMSRLWSR